MRIAVCDNDSAQVEQIIERIQKMEIASQCDAYFNPHKMVEAVKNGFDYEIIVMNIN